MADGRKVAIGIGIGCLVVIGLMAIAAGACGVWVYSEAQRIEREMEDPEARGGRAASLLGVDELPDGYYPMAAFSVPFVMDTVLLSDVPPDEDGRIEDFGERGFIYVNMIRLGQDEQELRDFFEGRTDDLDVLEDNGINVDTDEIIGRGVVDLQYGRLMYVTQRGDVGMRRQRGEGIATIGLVECPDDDAMRIGIWFGPDPAPDAPLEEVDLSGTPADEMEMAAFYGRFRLCD